MPEIGEVARIVHYLRKHVVGRTIAAVQVQEDEIIYGKVGTTAGAFQKAMTGKKVVGARQQGKYFWLEMSSPPHPLMHLGMSGWMRFSNDDTAHYKPTAKKEEEPWPPRFWKFVLRMAEEPACEVAYVDARRLGRIRLVDAPADQMRNTTPLKENGPDPVIDRNVLTLEWFKKKLKSKKVPIKALLLDQGQISGVGNWVGDEVLYQARVHPEQYSNTFDDDAIKRLHDALLSVCQTACETLAESDKFPENWLMKYRWGKGKKDQDRLPNGDKIVFLKVGGRTSAVVPRVQKKTGDVAGDVSPSVRASEEPEKEDSKPKSKAKKAASKSQEPAAAAARKRGRRAVKEESEDDEDAKEDVDEEDGEEKEVPVKKKSKPNGTKVAASGKKAVDGVKEEVTGRRRSSRLSK